MAGGGATAERSARKLDVVFCTLEYPPGLCGGAEHQASLQAEELARRDHRVTVVCPRARGMRSESRNGVRILRLPKIRRRPFNTVSYLLMLTVWMLVRGRRYDMFHVHLATIQAHLVVAVATLIRRPVYVKVAAGGSIGDVNRGRPLRWLTRSIGFRRAARVQALSQEIENDLVGVGVAKQRIVRIPNGLDLQMFAPVDKAGKQSARAALSLPVAPIIVLYVGRFVQYKGLADLLEAWRIASPSNAVLLLVGAPTPDLPFPVPRDREGLLVRPWTDDVAGYLHAADVFVHPSHSDGMSNSLLEAMACGVAPVATAIGAVDGLLEDGCNSLLVPAHAPVELATALARVTSDQPMRAQIGQAAAHTALRYSIDVVVDRIENVYREIVAPC
jgi:glycosyltransferase involved in cell wall biosynthesis